MKLTALHAHPPSGPNPFKLIKLAGAPHQPTPTRLMPADFSGVISHPKKNAPPDPNDPAAQHQALVRQAQQWVGQTFFGTLMKQMHQSPFKSDLFDGGRGGQAFSEMYDQKLIEHMSRGAGNKLVNAIVRKLEAATAYGKQQRPATRPLEGTEAASRHGVGTATAPRAPAGRRTGGTQPRAGSAASGVHKTR
jgi:Rod binding domain-containing protein